MIEFISFISLFALKLIDLFHVKNNLVTFK